MSSGRHGLVQPRPSPPHVRKPATKAARAAAPSKSTSAPRITIKGTKSAKKAKDLTEDIVDDDDDDMGTSFLQFCATCEKQIVVPNSSILYCSESCRRGDFGAMKSCAHLMALSGATMPSPYTHDMDDPFGTRIPTYVTPLKPTPRTLPDGSIPPELHNAKSDLDPTEWKPAEAAVTDGKSPTKSCEWKPKLVHRPSSEASSYLSQFHRFSDSLVPKRRPLTTRSTVSTRATPSLTHTPTASTSSEESLTSLAGTPYEFVARPAFSMPSVYTTAHVSGGVNVIKADDDLTYEKKHIGASLGSATGSLKKLLGTAGGM